MVEQAHNAKGVDLRTDVYSLGATFYHILTGRVPFEGDSPIEVGIKVATADFPPMMQVRADTPPALAAMIEKMLARKAQQRYQSAAELLAALGSLDRSPSEVKLVAEVAAPAAMQAHAAVYGVIEPAREPIVVPEAAELIRKTRLAEQPARLETQAEAGGLSSATVQVPAAVETGPPVDFVGLALKEIGGMQQTPSPLSADPKLDVTVGSVKLTPSRLSKETRAANATELVVLGKGTARGKLIVPEEMPGVVSNMLAAFRAKSALWASYCGALAAVIVLFLVTMPGKPAKRPPSAAPSIAINPSIAIKLVYIPPGKFTMGSPKTEKDRYDNESAHEVEITKGFYMGAYEVTQEEYEAVMGKNPSWFSPTGGGKAVIAGLDTRRFPVESVSWQDAVDFCSKLSQNEKKTYDLPTEAEWEYACRAATRSAYSFGDTISQQKANYGDEPKRSTKVGSYPPNDWGLYEMHGNVWEWCKDWYGNYPESGPQSPYISRVLRGGSFNYNARFCRSAFRYVLPPGDGSYYFGFRVVCRFP